MVKNKEYLKWEYQGSYGITLSQAANIVTVDDFLVLIASCHHVYLWNVRTKSIARVFTVSEFCRVSRIAKGRNLAVGYNDGKVRLFDFNSSDCLAVLCGHKSEVTCLNFNQNDTLLLSGGKDTNIVIWDVIDQVGLYRLLGHSDAITDASFLKNDLLATSSKDCLIKFWDLKVQHCFHTVVGHKTPVTNLTFLANESILVTGSQDPELRFYVVEKKSEPVAGDDKWSNFAVSLMGTHLGNNLKGVISVVKNPIVENSLLCLGKASKLVEKLTLVKVDGLLKQYEMSKSSVEKEDERFQLSKYLKTSTFRASDVIKSFSFIASTGNVYCSLSNNSIDCIILQDSPRDVSNGSFASANSNGTFLLPGHRSDARTLSLDSDSSLIISCSKESIRVWNKSTMSCIRCIESGYALTSCIVPGNKHVIIGTKTGQLCIIDIGNSQISATIDGHLQEIWAMQPFPNMRGIVTGGSDKCLKFWDYVLEAEENDDKLTLNLSLARKLTMDEDILAVNISEDSRYIAVALLDCTVKVLFFDSLKFFLNLYGHKLPVTSVDISTDGTLIVTGSADRNIKIWGMDFGDCHRSLFAHAESVTCVRFVPNTHLVFTAGKDGLIKQWDADKFQLVQTLQAHFDSTVWTLEVGPNGDFVVSSGSDKAVRIWERTMEPLIISEEEENEREKELDKEIGENLERLEPNLGQDVESTIASKKTAETLKGAELLMESLEICEQTAAGEKVVLLQALGKTAEQYLLESLAKISANEMEQSLMMLPFSYAMRLIETCSNKNFVIGFKREVCYKIILTLIRLHHGRFVLNQEFLNNVIGPCGFSMQSEISRLKRRVLFNMSALQYLKNQIEAKEETKLFADATGRFNEKAKPRRKRDKAKAILTVVS